MKQRYSSRIIKTALLLLCAVIFTALFSVLSVQGADPGKNVRVGWHEEPYFITDNYGRCSGYSYDYQRKVAAYTGWTYEYVEGTFSELLQKLKDGEIDMLGNVSYLEERAEYILYSSLPMGTESYYVFISPNNKEITSEDFTSLQGKKVGVTKGSMQEALYIKWAESHGIQTEVIEMTCTDEESLALLDKEFDAFVSVDVYSDPEVAVPVSKVGSSDYYFAVSKNRPDLLIELDAAMNRIQDENAYFSNQLHEKYLKNGKTDLYLTAKELSWLTSHKNKIRVGYQDRYLAFCASDEETGELTGALKDCLKFFETALENAELEFEAVSYPNAAEAIDAMKKGEVDCMFPANLTEYDSATLGVVMSPPLMRTEMDAVVRAATQKEFVIKEDVTVAVNWGNTNYDMFLADHYPSWKRMYFADTPTGLEAVANGDADCVIISNYRYNNISKQCEKLHLTTVYTGVDMDYCFAVAKGETEIYSILSRAICAIPDSVVHTALTYYSTEDVKTSFVDLIRDNLFLILSIVAVVLLVILILTLRNVKTTKKVKEEEHIVDDLNKRVFVDALTSVRNKGAFNDYIQGMQEKLDSGELSDFAIGVFDCNNLKKINDHHGHDKGDIYIKTASRLICEVFDHSPVFRIGGDEFAVILQGDDYDNRENLVSDFEKRQKDICESAERTWEEVRVALGVAVYDPNTDRSVNDTVRRADKIMYENKRIGKAAAK